MLYPQTTCMCPVVALWLWYSICPAAMRDRHGSTTSSDSIPPANAGATEVPSLELVHDGAPRYSFGTHCRESFQGGDHPWELPPGKGGTAFFFLLILKTEGKAAQV